ncbi:intracellular short-chain-length polyhydroxyalkanoate depolymerase [Paenibacillus pasadenensis]|uniref:intracellular short-chain-length polyhydroxyalkanoate depolymerase n=1 Tax=Paenibacillus TaxID=44249 RepID=UPI00048FC8C2|nr:alpha/beta hydrolase [Paenibacillus pasadenensis]
MSVELKSVRLDSGETIGYRQRSGGEEAVLLLHGNMNSSVHWDVVLERMEARYAVYAVDLRGFGTSTYLAPAVRLSDYADDVAAFMEKIGLPRAIVWGWSTGGGVAMELAARHPERVDRLVLLASVSTRGYPQHEDGPDGRPDLSSRLTSADGIRADRRNRRILQANEERDKPFMKALFDAVIYERRQPEPQRYEAYLEDILTQRNLMDIYEALNAFNISRFDHPAGAGTGAVDLVEAPVLAVRGTEDKVISEAMHRELMEDFRGRAAEALLPGCGHSPLIDDPERLLDVVQSFLQEGA